MALREAVFSQPSLCLEKSLEQTSNWDVCIYNVWDKGDLHIVMLPKLQEKQKDFFLSATLFSSKWMTAALAKG